jgi:pimeloyl-ACP methyl ester carboxylesterase
MKHLLLLHGALGHPSQFEPYEPELSQYFYLHKLLFEGHGSSPIPEEGIYMERYIAQVSQYCEDNQLDDVCIFGYSMGGYVALCYALEQPQKVQSVITLATKLQWTEESALKESKMLNPDVIEEKVPKYAMHLAGLHGSDKWKGLLSAISGMINHLGKRPLLTPDEFVRLKDKVQLMVGDKDTLVSVEETYAASKEIPGAGFAVLPQTVHPFEKVRPELLTALLMDFLVQSR